MLNFPCPVSVEPTFLPDGSTFGRNAVLRPRSVTALARCVAVAAAARRPVVAEAGDPGYNPATLAKRVEGAVVLKLDAFNAVTAAPDGSVVAGAAASIASVVRAAADAGVLLPAPDLPYESVADALASGVQSLFSRTVGTLRAAVVAATLVSRDGAVVHAVGGRDDAALDAALAAGSDSFVVSLSFRGVPATEADDYWLARSVMSFDAGVVRRMLPALFGPVAKDMPKSSDIVVHAKPAMYNTPVAVVYVSGRGAHRSDAFLAAVTSAILSAQEDAADTQGVFEVFRGAAAGPQTLATGEIGRRTPSAEVVPLYNSFPREQMAANIARIVDVLDETLGVDAEGNLFSTAVSSSSRLSINREGGLEISAFLFKPIHPDARDTALVSHFGSVFTHRSFPDTPELAALHESGTPPSVAPDIRLLDGPIPNFRGNVYMQGDLDYDERAEQYATSSTPVEDMTPYMVAYPLDEADITAAIKFAKSFAKQKSVVGRSGGHQYSGLSSGGGDTIVLSMDYFRDVVPDPRAYNVITVGVGVRLTHGADAFNEAGVTVPHGECPFVAFGGHVQSGGYGHLLRSYGLILDHVRSFRIVIGDGSAHDVLKPGVSGTRTLPNNDDVYFAVLGGGPSSFGIVTTITLEAIKNSDHPHSGGLSASMTYQKESFRRIMEELQTRTKAIYNGDTLQADSDMMATALSFDFRNFVSGSISPDQPDPEDDADDWFPFISGDGGGGSGRSSLARSALNRIWRHIPNGILLLELLYGDHNASEETYEKTIADFRQLYKEVRREDLYWPRLAFTGFNGKETLSSMSNSFVRRSGTGKDGREFVYPYEKRLNGSFKPLTDGFVSGFVDLCTRVIEDRRVRLVFQVGLGGSRHRDGGFQQGSDGRKVSITALSHRECTISVVFDVFYTSGHKQVALDYQNDMGALLDREFPEGQDVRFHWGGYGNVDVKEVWQYYYDSPELYKRLQGIKADVDPTDVFHTRFNVQLPSNHSVSS